MSVDPKFQESAEYAVQLYAVRKGFMADLTDETTKRELAQMVAAHVLHTAEHGGGWVKSEDYHKRVNDLKQKADRHLNNWSKATVQKDEYQRLVQRELQAFMEADPRGNKKQALELAMSMSVMLYDEETKRPIYGMGDEL